MASIDDFVYHRWADAKEALRELDPDFVRKLESTVRLQQSGLTPPWSPAMVERKPKQLLSREWHRLLEACHGLTMEALLLQGTAVDLTAATNTCLQPVESGRRFFHHLTSWFVQAITLTEYADKVIGSTVEVYLADCAKRATLVKFYQGRVYQEITKPIEKARNEFVHVKARPWAGRTITEDPGWEPSVAGGLTPQQALVKDIYPCFGDKVKSGEYNLFLTETTSILDCLGSILQELEPKIS